MAYEKANVKSGRLFRTAPEKMQQNPKLPLLNGTIVVDGIVLYLGLWQRKSKNGNTYYTAELTYPNDETARLHADGAATSEAAKKEEAYDREHPRSKEHAKSAWQARANDEAETRMTGGTNPEDDTDLPF